MVAAFGLIDDKLLSLRVAVILPSSPFFIIVFFFNFVNNVGRISSGFLNALW